MSRLLHAWCLWTFVCFACFGAPAVVSGQVISHEDVSPRETPSTADASPSLDLPQAKSSGLFADIVSDFRRLPSSESLTILSTGAAAAAIGHRFDASTTRALSGSANLRTITHSGNGIGSMHAQFGAALATFTVGKVTHNAAISALGTDLVRAQVVTQTLTQGVKLAVGRTRPDGTQYSFPSGHTSTTFATATVLHRHFGWKAGVPAFALASYVAAARVQAKRHYVSDVAFGAALGITVGRTVTVGHGNARFAVSPAVAPGIAGISLTWVGQR